MNQIATNAGDELRRARLESGLSQMKLANFANTFSEEISQIETGLHKISFEQLQILLSLTQHRLVSIPTNAKTPEEISGFIKSAIDAENPRRAYRAFLAFSKTLQLLDPAVRLALTLNRPESTGDRLYDAAIASLIQHWLQSDSLPVPFWVNEESFFLQKPTHFGYAYLAALPTFDESPLAFKQHNVIFSAVALETGLSSMND